MVQQAPDYAASPLGSFPELSQMYATSFSSPVSNARAGIEYQQDQVAAENAKRAAAESQARSSSGGGSSGSQKYTAVKRPDGGYGFYGPDGKEVTAAEYANTTGKKLTDVLKDSQNPIDVRYVQDQKNLIKYLQAKSQSKFDPKQKAVATQIEKQVDKAYGLNLAKTNPTQLIQAMQQNYPTIYGANQDNAPGFSGASTFLPTSVQTQTDNPFGLSQSGGLSNLKKKPQQHQSLLSQIGHRLF
jgi:hypothetical protein